MPIICGDCNYEKDGNSYVCIICGDEITEDAFKEFKKLNEMSNQNNKETRKEIEK